MRSMNKACAISVFLLLLLLALAAPMAIYPAFLMRGLILALFASAFNLLLGFGGLLSFGHAAFFGWAAYATAYAAKVWNLGPELSILVGVLTATGLGAAFGLLAIRRLGIYFAMITLALAQMMYFVALQAPFTNSEDGIQSVPRGYLLGLVDLNDQLSMYYVVLAVFLLALALIYRIVHSPFGQVLKAIRENETRAESMGYATAKFKLAAFILSAALSGLAGGLNALVFQLASLSDVSWHLSGEVVLMTLLGGVGTMLGPTIGAFVVVIVQTVFAEWGAWVTIIQGVIFTACVLLFRKGIVGEIGSRIKPRLIKARELIDSSGQWRADWKSKFQPVKIKSE